MKEELNSNNENNFGLPSDYFKISANAIQLRIEWMEEHKEFSKLIQYRNKNAFTIPDFYFQKSEIKLEQFFYPKLNSLKNNSVFGFPKDYFEEKEIKLFEDISIHQENELENFPVLKFIPKKNIFITPSDYFAFTEKNLNTLLQEEKHTRIIDFVFSKGWLSAVAILMVTLGFVTYFQFFNSPEVRDCGTIACVDRIDLVKSKDLENLDSDDLYELVNPKSLEQNLENKKTKQETKIDSNENLSDTDILDEI